MAHLATSQNVCGGGCRWYIFPKNLMNENLWPETLMSSFFQAIKERTHVLELHHGWSLSVCRETQASFPLSFLRRCFFGSKVSSSDLMDFWVDFES